MSVTDKATGKTSARTVTLSKDEGNRPETSADGLASLKPVIDGGVITAGNVSQLSDGASACVDLAAGLATQRALQPLGRYVAMAPAGTEPAEIGIGGAFAEPTLLNRFRLRNDDLGRWALN